MFTQKLVYLTYDHKSIVHSNIFHNSPKRVEITFNRLMDKQNVICSYNKILFKNKKEWSADSYYNMDEPREHYSE